jgi:hypothetical protein
MTRKRHAGNSGPLLTATTWPNALEEAGQDHMTSTEAEQISTSFDIESRQDNLRTTPNIVDQYCGLLDNLTPSQRRGLVAKLAIEYYDGWRPTRSQLAAYVQKNFGVIV